ncbi:hypothetical protein [Roseobacter ponti]|uniref:Uncharacterized protein n=1 Tax=Roseobacter ponti TaxID=1891787 RepID=A0A858SU68_9RHOB|nr:hypothetical protein [Roseobacter ponti]QJF51850.1 hypothetical protein G3256_12090 [Roseobacter ponti]
MPSIVCKSKDQNLSERDKLRAGLVFLGKTYSDKLKNITGTAEAVAAALNTCVQSNDHDLLVRVNQVDTVITSVAQVGNSDNINCENNGTKILKITVAEDDDGNQKKMTVVVPADRSGVSDPENLYTETVAEDVDTLWSNGADADVDAAAQYTLASISFRRCR